MAKKKSTAAGKDSSPPAVPEEPDLPNPPAFAWEEPAWATKVREKAPNTSPTGPPPDSLVEADVGPIRFEAPFVELTLVETGRYVGPTRGRVCQREAYGFDFMTHQGVYFVPWANLAFWRYLPET